jgi:predicted Zn-dependent protease
LDAIVIGLDRLARPRITGESPGMRHLLLTVLIACGGPQLTEHHGGDLTKALPATLEANRPRVGEARPLKIRVWADAGVRALPRWKEDIAEQIDYASQLLTPLVGVRLTVDGIKDWNRTGEPGAALKALAETDDAKDVAWVLGYVTPGDVAAKAISELGDAQALGKYVIVRAWAEKPETDTLSPLLPDLKPNERTEALGAHRRHKQSVVLLHMLAQTLGAIAESDPAWIQHPTYSPKQSTFSDRNRELMQITVDARLADAADPTIAHDLLENIEKTEWGGWIASDRDQVVTLLRTILDAAKSGKTASDVPTAAYEQFDRIRELAKRGKPKDALLELDNLLSAYPGNASMHELKCEIMLAGVAAKGKPGVAAKPSALDKATRAACNRVSELVPGDPSPHFAVGEALARAGDIVGAHGELAQAASKIGNLKAGQSEAWKKLIAMDQAMGSLTWTEEALAAAKLDTDPVAAQIAQTRARYGVPRGTKVVKPEDEGALVAAVRGALDLIYGNKYPDAERALAAGEKKWPGAPGLAAARCDLQLRQGQADAARATCQRALTADPNESWALYLAAVIDFRDPSPASTRTGIDKLRTAILVDPELGQAWRTLGKAYARAKDQPALDQLAKDYAAKFGQSLPP